ncbi:MAG TPA: hypothetical protein VIU61_14805 [Kofleriaceae bacterium]
MQRHLTLLLLLTACTGTVTTGPGPSRPPPPRDPVVRDHRPPPPDRPVPPPAWDSTGWIMLGENAVDGRVDTDRIDVSQKKGKIDKLMVVVLDSDLEMIDMTVQFLGVAGKSSGKQYKPATAHYFRESSRTRAIDLPNAEIIRYVEFKYRNLPGGGKARVQVWGKLGNETATAPPPPPPPAAPAWDSSGWTLLGEHTVDGKVDTDRIDVSQKKGTFSKLTFVVLDSDLEMIDTTIQFLGVKGKSSGKQYKPKTAHYFRENSRTRAIDLPNAEIIRYVEFKYKNLPGGGKARVQVWGR